MPNLTPREKLLLIIRTGLRRETTALDDSELVPMIDACKQDLYRAGVSIISESDPSTVQAIKNYCIYNVEKDEKFMRFYEKIRDGMALDRRYRGDDDAESLAGPCVSD